VALFNNPWNLFGFKHKEKPLQQSRLQVKTDLEAITEVWQWFEQFTSPLLPQLFWWECEVALTEGFTNVVRHAHQHLPQTTPIEIELKVFAQYLEMRIWDRGKPFDLQAKLQSLCQEQSDALEQEQSDALEREGGRGLIFMHKLMDELDYLRGSDGRNCLLLRKRR
jgi:serine/threonine-protein kinase RsbW